MSTTYVITGHKTDDCWIDDANPRVVHGPHTELARVADPASIDPIAKRFFDCCTFAPDRNRSDYFVAIAEYALDGSLFAHSMYSVHAFGTDCHANSATLEQIGHHLYENGVRLGVVAPITPKPPILPTYNSIHERLRIALAEAGDLLIDTAFYDVAETFHSANARPCASVAHLHSDAPVPDISSETARRFAASAVLLVNRLFAPQPLVFTSTADHVAFAILLTRALFHSCYVAAPMDETLDAIDDLESALNLPRWILPLAYNAVLESPIPPEHEAMIADVFTRTTRWFDPLAQPDPALKHYQPDAADFVATNVLDTSKL